LVGFFGGRQHQTPFFFEPAKRGFGVDCGITTAPFVAVVEEEGAAKAIGGEPLLPGWRAPVTTKGTSKAA
jgi:hypothetical protein